jgi:hypothetical protein
MVKGISLSRQAGLFEQERLEIKAFMKKMKIYLSSEVSTIMNVLHKLLTYHPEAVKKFNIDDDNLREFMAKEAERFLDRHGEEINQETIRIEKANYYFYHFARIFRFR